MFIDRVTVQLSAGKGGNGVVAWRREKYIPKGGPCGGDGGKGGSVILIADVQEGSLDWFRNRRILKAENGAAGGPNRRKGRNGKDLILKVPCGTLVKDTSTGEVICDLTTQGQEFLISRGGKGGYGNDHFKSPTNQAPNICTLGQYGEECEVEFELKLIADVGFIGFPNAGKSTLLQALAHRKVKTAAYPFTTLHPNLGFIQLKNQNRIYIADIPGIIEGAHRNRGLGFEFLRHIERTKLLIYLLDASGIDGRDPLSDFEVLISELKAYNPELLKRPHLVVLNKIDADESGENIVKFKEKFQEKIKVPVLEISALTGAGLADLQDSIVKNFEIQHVS